MESRGGCPNFAAIFSCSSRDRALPWPKSASRLQTGCEALNLRLKARVSRTETKGEPVMSHTMEAMRDTVEQGEPVPSSRDGAKTELDLERLVWDPEYRAAMRPLLHRAG